MVVDYVKDREVVPYAYLVVVHVMGRSDLQAPCTEPHLDVAVLDNRNLLVYQRNKYLLAFQPMVSFILRVDTYRGIRHDGLRTRGRNDDILVCRIPFTVRYEVPEVVELADGVPVDHLLVTHCGQPDRVPVYHPDTSIDIAFPVEIDECVYHRIAQVGVHGEFGPVPVA